MQTVRSAARTVVWSEDGRTVVKRYDRRSWPFLGVRHAPWEVEWRVGSLLLRQPPPVPFARLVGADRRRLTLHFEAIHGAPLGPKFPYPADLSDGDVADLIGLALAMRRYRPHAPFAGRFDLARRLRRAVSSGVLSAEAAAAMTQQALDDPPVLVFGHGDITARNVMRSSETGEAVLIDWEWAGRYPRGWDLAFVWLSLIDVPGARAEVEAAVPHDDEAWFWRSALLLQVLHLGMWVGWDGLHFRAAHERTRDELVERVCARPATRPTNGGVRSLRPGTARTGSANGLRA